MYLPIPQTFNVGFVQTKKKKEKENKKALTTVNAKARIMFYRRRCTNKHGVVSIGISSNCHSYTAIVPKSSLVLN